MSLVSLAKPPLSDVDIAIKSIGDAMNALQNAKEAVKDIYEADKATHIRTWIAKKRTRFPGLTNSEIALLERLASDLEAP